MIKIERGEKSDKDGKRRREMIKKERGRER